MRDVDPILWDTVEEALCGATDAHIDSVYPALVGPWRMFFTAAKGNVPALRIAFRLLADGTVELRWCSSR